MTTDYSLLARFLRDNPFQPATAFWRAIEIEQVIRHSVPEGLGLDLGCGDGRVTQMVLERARPGTRPLVGVDPDPAEAGMAASLGIYQRVLAVPGDKIPAADASFDWVFSNSVLEHIDALAPVLHEVARLLKPGGTFLFTVPSDGFHRCLKGPILPFVSRQTYLDDLDRRLAHKRYWSAADWREHLLAEGLEVVDITPYMPARAARRWETISRLTAGILYFLFRRRKAPIGIQRTLHLRGSRLRIPGAPSYVLARLLTLGIVDEHDPVEEHNGFGCLLVVARKSSLPAQAAA
jgi:SAM-dependent methyltransferase